MIQADAMPYATTQTTNFTVYWLTTIKQQDLVISFIVMDQVNQCTLKHDM